MKISSESFVYKTAYFFTDANKRPVGYINGCSLFWRFIFFGGMYLFLTTILFPIILTFSLVIMPPRWILAILIGRRLEHYRRTIREDDWMDVVANNVWPGNWRSVPIASWPRIFGWRILPIGVVAVLSACCLIGLTVWINWVVGGLAAQGDSSALIMLIGEIVIPVCIFAVFSASAIRRSSVGQLVSASVKSFKDRTCPVVEVVD